MWTLYAYDELNDSKPLKKQHLYQCTLRAVILSILNLLYKIHRLLYKKWLCIAVLLRKFFERNRSLTKTWNNPICSTVETIDWYVCNSVLYTWMSVLMCWQVVDDSIFSASINSESAVALSESIRRSYSTDEGGVTLPPEPTGRCSKHLQVNQPQQQIKTMNLYIIIIIFLGGRYLQQSVYLL